MPPKSEKTLEKSASAEKISPESTKLSAARERDLDAAISSITKAYGDGSIMRLGAAQALRKIEIPSAMRNAASGVGIRSCQMTK